MNILCRSRTLLSSVCRHGSLLEQTGAFKCVGVLSTARGCSRTVNLASCQQHSASLRYQFTSQRCFSDSGGDRHSDSREMFKEETAEISDNRNSSINPRPAEAFTLDVLVSLLHQENAIDLCVIKVPTHIRYTEYFLVVSGLSPRHVRAMALYAVKVYKFLKKNKDPNVKVEGKEADDWICIDFGNMVVHFMLPETREQYELEKLWTLRAFDEQLKKIPAETLPEDFILDAELTK
uniref:Mitochondrial assembly of ribosomal large subunit protein 1 n=1 Tax=Iconisemion striatum TaxID=60296 RepID=A0A1A7X4D3_9TELE